MVSEEQECDMELAPEKIPVPPMEDTVKEPAKVENLKPEVPRKKHRKKELREKILKQMEFYFGDENLSKDRYLTQLIDKDPWVDLNIFIEFKKMKILTTDVSRIAKALKKSAMLEVSEDGRKVRRTTPIQEKENSEECSIYVQRLSPEADHDSISKNFSQYGPIDYISIPKYKNKAIKGFAFVKYKAVEYARKCLKAFRAKGCELPSQTSQYSHLRITTHEDCDEEVAKEPILKKEMTEEKVETENCEESNSRKDSKSQIPQNGQKKKKKRVSFDESASNNEGLEESKKSKKMKHVSDKESDQTDSVSNPSKLEKEHRSARKRRVRYSESLNVPDGNYELNDSSATECNEKRKRIKHESSELEPPSLQQRSDEVNVQKKKTKRDKMTEHLKRATVKIEMEPPCSEPSNFKSGCLVTGKRENGVMNPDSDKNLPRRIEGDLQDESRHDLPNELLNFYQTNQCRSNLPHNLIKFMYQLDLSVLCSLRKLTYEHKYPSLSLEFEDSEIDKFNNIVFRYKEKSIHAQIENVHEYYVDNAIGYAGLFTKEKGTCFSIYKYFDSFVKYIIADSDISLNNAIIQYLIIYTNSGLDLTEDKKLKRGRSRNFYPFKFDSVNMKECEILKDCFFTNDDAQGRGFYQFSRDETMREELLKRLEFSPALQKAINERNLSEEFETKIKVAFLDKLVFVVNQPSREELHTIVKSEIENNSAVQDYIILQERVLSNLVAPGKPEKLRNNVSKMTYEFSLLTLFLHDMFSKKNIFSINFEGKSYGISNDIAVHYKDRIIYVKAHNVDSDIGYSQLFPSREREGENMLSINKYFSLFVEGLKFNVRYFILYTNADLNLTEEKRFQKNKSRNFCPLKFDRIDIQKKKYKVLRNCSCINEKGLYQFSQEQATREKVVGQLKLPPLLQKEKEAGRLSDKKENEIKQKFFDRLIFAVNQYDREEVNSFIRKDMDKKRRIIPYNHEELSEIALRWLESHEFGHITKKIMEKLLKDIQNDRSSYDMIQNRDINEEIDFAKSVVGRKGTPTFNQFLDFLIKGEGKKYLAVLKREKIGLAKVSSILNRAGNTSVKAFERLYELWFDKNGNKMHYLKTLEKEGMNVASMSGILNGAGINAAEAFKGLYDLWFDEEGNKTVYLKSVEEQGINLSSISSILNGAGSNSEKSYRDLYNLWFEEEGTKTKYLKILEKEGMNVASMSGILSGAGNNAAEAFKGLYDLWFDEEGNKSIYLNSVEKQGINLSNISSILSGAGSNSAKSYRDLYNLWFEEEGTKTKYLKTLEKARINLASMCSILRGAGSNAAQAFQELYHVWFDAQGNKTKYLKTLEKERINLSSMCSILQGAASHGAQAFKLLYYLWFDEEGSKTEYLKSLEKERINLASMSSILHKAAANAAQAFKELYLMWFDAEGNGTKYLKTLEQEKISLASMCSILSGAGSNAAQAFQSLYHLWFDEEGKKTKYLKTLEKEEISLANMTSILNGAGSNAAKAFKNLYDLWFDADGNKSKYLKTLEKEGINLTTISSILSGAGANFVKAFKDLYDLWFDDQGCTKQHLNDFIRKKAGEKSFRINSLSGILSGAGANAIHAFEKLHRVCFSDDGKRTRLLDDFFNEGFEPRNLSSILCAAGVRASAFLKKLHCLCFDEEGERTELLDDFYKIGFTPGDLCSILSGAVNSFENFHDFCFIGETKKYLNHFVNDKQGFSASNLSEILHGAKANICSALRDFHDVCFDETGNKTRVLGDFHKVGFKPSNLSKILCMAGNNTSSILVHFHKSCFNAENYLNHFLVEKELFTPKNLSKTLERAGLNICPTFEKLHDLCFDKEGNKTNYLESLIQNNASNQILNILFEKVRKARSTL